jgi:hypothetical protein
VAISIPLPGGCFAAFAMTDRSAVSEKPRSARTHPPPVGDNQAKNSRPEGPQRERHGTRVAYSTQKRGKARGNTKPFSHQELRYYVDTLYLERLVHPNGAPFYVVSGRHPGSYLSAHVFLASRSPHFYNGFESVI